MVLPVLGIALSKFSKRFRRASTQMQEQNGDLTIHLHETISGIRIVKAFGMESYENRRFAERNKGLFNSLMRSIKTSAISHPIMEVISMFGISTVILYRRLLRSSAADHDGRVNFSRSWSPCILSTGRSRT